jgi:hypothetical protein
MELSLHFRLDFRSEGVERAFLNRYKNERVSEKIEPKEPGRSGAKVRKSQT